MWELCREERERKAKEEEAKRKADWPRQHRRRQMAALREIGRW
jgi:hypothetical protein